MENAAEIKYDIRMSTGEIGYKYVSQTWLDPVVRNLLATA